MIRADAELNGDTSFREWASLFSGNLFVMIQIFMDESGTDGYKIGKNEGSAPTVSGWIAGANYWAGFGRRWKMVLDNHTAPYFHFCEFADKENKKKLNGNPYIKWSEEKRRSFLFDLAILTSKSTADAIPVGGSFSLKMLCESGIQGNAFEGAVRTFFEDLRTKLNRHWPDYTGKVLFVYDSCEDPNILVPLAKVHGEYKEIDSRFGGLTFEDDKDPKFRPLQAADLLSYACRQQADRVWESGEKKIPEQRTLDFILNRNVVKRGNGLNNKRWLKLVELILDDDKTKTEAWRKNGSKQQYYPAKHFPFEKYGFKATKRNAI